MAEKQRSVILNITTKTGVKYQVTCPEHISDIIRSSTTDPAVKQSLIDSFITSRSAKLYTPNSVGKESSPKLQFSLKTKETEDLNGTNRDRTPVFHVWKEKEEEKLVFLRHEMHDDFVKNKNHNKLWAKITEDLKSIQCHITPIQAFNKYAALKKKWKEIIDAPTGSESRYFRHRTSFDNVYGHKASTKPASTIDTDADDAQPNTSTKLKNANQSKKKKCNKRQSTEILECIQSQYDDFKEDMMKMHKDKMARMDRMLDIYERELRLHEQIKSE